MKYINIREEELKNKVAQDYFWLYDNTKIIGNVDFCVAMHQPKKELFDQENLLWAEAKKGSSDIYKSFVQLILTIGKARTFDKHLPPAMLGAFDAEKFAFIPYNEIQEIFYQNDFNWNVTPSNHETREFNLVLEKVRNILEKNTFIFNYEKDDRELKKFIKKNFIVGKWGISKIQIDKNTFTAIYDKWFKAVKPSIAVNWDIAKKNGIIDGDFYLADLLSHENNTLKEKLFVLLKHDHYELDRKIDELGMFSSKTASFNDKQKAHTQFWNKYERPPKEEYWDYIVERRDLLVPQDIRERKGSFFTPQIWVELSQKYIADVFGENWQDEYYVWDCAAGTGNLLAGLTNKYNIWASTLDKQDVKVMHDRIKNGANLLDSHVFQFDFLNDDFSKLPQPLQEIINDENKRKKLIIYINPPYAEAGSKTNIKNKDGISKNSYVYKLYKPLMSKGSNELFTQFLIRIYREIPSSKIANFSKLKNLQSSNFRVFRENFRAKLEKIFCVPADTFDNVKGQFPIGFFIWDSEKNELFTKIKADFYDKNGVFLMFKNIYSNDNKKLISKWIFEILDEKNKIGHLSCRGSNDFQGQSTININSYLIKPKDRSNRRYRGTLNIDANNLIKSSIFFAVRHCIKATWINDRDQFLHPQDGWQNDSEFQNDCLAYTLFHGQNRISSAEGTNHWIPFTEQEIDAKEKFSSSFITDFIAGKLEIEAEANLFSQATKTSNRKLEFSPAAIAVFDAGRELWKYYHAQPNCNVNASLYDIRAYFQGRNAKGRMNSKSTDEVYTQLIANLRDALKILSEKIEPKVYEYGFLMP